MRGKRSKDVGVVGAARAAAARAEKMVNVFMVNYGEDHVLEVQLGGNLLTVFIYFIPFQPSCQSRSPPV